MNKFKVKKADLGRFKNNKLTLILGITVASIFLLIFLKAWLSDDKVALENLAESVGISRDPDEPAVVTTYNPGVTRKLSLEEAKKKIKQGNSDARRMMTEFNSYKIQQERLLKEFQKSIHLKMNFPGHLNYTDVDLEDDIGAIIGTTTNMDQSFAVIATSRKADVELVVAFLKEESENFPMLKGHEFQPDKAFQFTPPASTGLGPLTVIPSTEFEGRGLYAVLAPRADEKGNYLFMMEAKKSHFDENEDGFEKMLDGMKAKP